MRPALLISSIAVVSCLIFVSCLPRAEENELVSITVESGPFEIVIPAFGELQAVTSTVIKIQANVRGSQTIDWLRAENSEVHSGDILARFDDSSYRRRIDEELYNIKLLDLTIMRKRHDIELRQKDLDEQLRLVSHEKELAETFAPRDESLFSRNEIIDATMNLSYLNEQKTHLEKQKSKFQEKAETELQILLLQRKTYQVKLDQFRETMTMLEIKAPHDGIFVYEQMWGGEKPRVGKSVWGGMVLGRLPDLKDMEAKVFVLEAEAGGLKQGLQATVILDAFPGKEYAGSVKRVDTMAKRLQDDSPFKYFEVIVSLTTTDTNVMKPGGQVRVKIYVEKHDSVLAVPNQTIFSEGEKYYVYRQHDGGFTKTEVTTGVRSITRTIITRGLQAHDTIALSRPESES